MAQLDTIKTQKTVGYIDRGFNHSKRQNLLEEEEKEIARLEAQQRGEDVQEDEQEEAPVEDTTQVVKKVQTEQEEDDTNLSGEEKSFKKRYGDLRRHMNEKQKEWEDKLTQLEERVKAGPEKVRPPKTDEDISAWAKKYPDVASIVETIAAKKAQELFAGAQERFKELDEAKWEAERTRAENAIRKVHTDFDDLKASDEFHDWANDQPKWVQDAIYENSDDPESVIRVIDLYKVDNGMTPSARKQEAKKAAATISKGSRTQIDADSSSGTFKESQVARMSSAEYEANADKIDTAIRNGKFVYDISGGAR